jgi:6-pyruvoyltetrahydropterin/6-carboxytetrahydropterin synthase
LVRLTRAIEFSTSLRYALPDLSEAANRERFGARAGHHGHNYRLEVTVRGEVDPVTGMVVDLKLVQELLDREVMARFDHKDLNCDTPYFEKLVASPENFAWVIRELLVEALPEGVELDRLRLRPDRDTWVDVIEPAPSA